MTSKRVSAAAAEMSRLAHRAMTAEQRKARARKAALARWGKARAEKAETVEKTS